MKIIKAALLGAFGTFGALFLSGCVTTYPYQTAFDACDAEAGACYRYCEEAGLSEGEYASCHADCEVGANRCFADAYDRYSYNRSAYGGSYYAPSWPWYGRYGAWGPSSGYYFGFSYSSGYSNYRHPYYGDRYYYGDRDRRKKKDRRRKDGDRGGAYAPPPGSPAANNPNRPRQMPKNRGVTPTPSAPVQSAPTQSTPPPAAAPRQQQPVRTKPSSKSRHKSGTPRSKERPRDY